MDNEMPGLSVALADSRQLSATMVAENLRFLTLDVLIEETNTIIRLRVAGDHDYALYLTTPDAEHDGVMMFKGNATAQVTDALAEREAARKLAILTKTVMQRHGDALAAARTDNLMAEHGLLNWADGKHTYGAMTRSLKRLWQSVINKVL